MIDPNIIIRGAERAQEQQAQNMQALGNFGQLVGSIALQNRANQMRQLSTPEERQKFANNSIFAPMLNATLKSDQAAAQKALLEKQKADAEVAKTNSEAFKNTQQGQGYGLDNSGKKLGAIQGAFQQAAMTGDKTQVLLGLDALQRTGFIAPEDYQHQFEIVKAMNPEDVKQYASGIALNNKDVAPYLFQTQNNRADNQTSRENNQATVNATMRGQDISAQTANDRLALDAIKLEQEQALKRGEFETMQGTDGKAYAVYRDGRVEPLLLSTGEAFTPQTSSNPVATSKAEEKLRINRVNAVLDEVSNILPQSTNSYIGRGIDYGARLFGGATSGDIAAAKLGTLGGQLVALMPKMSGPQSDKDVEMYKQMAGKLDDATVPIEVRQAALDTIRSLNNKYADMSNQGAGTPFKNAGQQPNEARLSSILFGQ